MNLRNTRLQKALSSLVTSDLPTQPATAKEPGHIEMLGAIGAALLAASQPTSEIDTTLKTLAAAYGNPDIRIVVLPTFVMLEDSSTTPPQTSVFPADEPQLRLDQAGAIEHLIRSAARELPEPTKVIEDTARIISQPPRFGLWPTLLGHVLLTVGFGLVLNPTLTSLPVYLILGVIVGLIVLVGSRVRTLSLVLPVFAAFVATGAVGAAAHLVEDNVLNLVTPAIVSLLPGLTLTIAAVELTNGAVIAGASRLVYGFARLALLAFGMYAGLMLTGASADAASNAERLGAWAPWVGILFVAAGYYLYSMAPKRSLLWILFALVVAYSAQTLGHTLVGADLSGLVGAIVVVPVIYLVSHLSAAPPPAVMLTSAYWMLVPGAMGFMGMSEAAAGSSGASGHLLQTIASILAIAIGMVLGTSISRDTSMFARAWNRHVPAPER